MPSSPYTRLKSGWREALRALMAKKNLSMRELSLKAGLNESAVSEWLRQSEKKKAKQPSFDALAAVADQLGVSLDVFTSSASPSLDGSGGAGA